jgi:hypothetical protein
MAKLARNLAGWNTGKPSLIHAVAELPFATWGGQYMTHR